MIRAASLLPRYLRGFHFQWFSTGLERSRSSLFTLELTMPLVYSSPKPAEVLVRVLLSRKLCLASGVSPALPSDKTRDVRPIAEVVYVAARRAVPFAFLLAIGDR